MTSITALTTHDGNTLQFTASELATTLANLNTADQSSCLGEQNIAHIRVGTTAILLMDLGWNVGRTLFETFGVTTNLNNPYDLEFTLNSTGYTLQQALTASGYFGTVTSLAQVYMAMYGSTDHPTLVSTNLVKTQGVNGVSAAELKELVCASPLQLVTSATQVSVGLDPIAFYSTVYSQTAVDGLLLLKQDVLTNNATAFTELLVGNSLRRLRAGNNVTVQVTGGDVEIAATGGLTTSDLNTALADYTTTTALTTLLANKQDLVSSAAGTGNALFSGSTVKRLDFNNDFTVSDNGSIVSVALANTYATQTYVISQLSGKQDALSTDQTASGIPVIDLPYDKVRRLDVSGDSIVQLSTVNSGGTIQLTCDGYLKSQIDGFLAGKQGTLSNNSGSTGTELLTGGSTLRKLRAGTGVSLALIDGDVTISSSGGGVNQSQVDTSIATALTSYSLTSDINTALALKNDVLTSPSGTGNAILASNTIKRLDFDASFSVTDANNKISVSLSTPLSQFYTSSAVDSLFNAKQDALTIPANASGTPCLDLSSGRTTVRKFQVSGDPVLSMTTINNGETIDISADGYTKTQTNTLLAAKENTITNGTSGIPLLINGVLRTLSFSGCIAYGFSNYLTEISINVPAYTQTESDNRYVQVDPEEITFINNSGPQLHIKTTALRSEFRYKGGEFRIRREATDGSFSNHVQFPDSTSGNTIFYNGITADAFQTSDARLKDNQEEISADEAMTILRAVTPKKYTRNDMDDQERHGFIAQELEAVCTRHFSCLVSQTDGDEETDPLKVVDYARLSCLLWRACQALDARVTELEAQLVKS